MTVKPVTHPARFSTPVLAEIDRVLAERLSADATLLDPFAGTGRVHTLPYVTVGVEIESEWAAMHPQTIHGDSTNLRSLFPAYEFDAIVTSPAYGNRMADNYAGDHTKRFTYRTALGRPLTDGNGAGLQWGDEYRRVHAAVWSECWAVLRSGGWFVVNLSNHVRAGVVQPVVEWHLVTLVSLGAHVDEVSRVATSRVGYGANRDQRVGHEHVLTLRKPGVATTGGGS